MKIASSVTILALAAGAAHGQLAVNDDLGAVGIGDVLNLIGTTIGGGQNANSYTGPLGQQIGFAADLSEFVYQFTLTEPTRLSIANNEGVFVGTDQEHYLTQSLATPGGVNSALAFVDEEGVLGNFLPGTYFLSVDTFAASDDGPFDISLSAEVVSAVAPSAINLGVAGTDADPFDANTFGSSSDTEIALFDALGNLLGNNDDANGTLQSQLTADSLEAGEYFLAVGTFNTIFGADFGADAAAAQGGAYTGLVNGLTIAGDLAAGEVDFYRFEIIPAPGAGALLGLAGLVGLRRRR